MNLSDEQNAVVGAASFGSSLTAPAFAGAAKTTTCVEVAKVCRDSLYLAFNNEAARQAKSRFPLSTEIKTAHGLAFASEKQFFRSRLTTSTFDLRRAYAPLVEREIASAFGVIARREYPEIAHAAFDAVNAFLASADTVISAERHVPESPHDPERVAAVATAIAREMIDRNGSLPCTHDAYLKAFQLAHPRIRAKTIIFDEAQDASEAMLDIVLRQHAQQVFVGDRWQAIYGWRGAVNAFDYLTHLDAYPLSRCWRFGPRVAAVANRLLSALGETVPLIGAGAYDTLTRGGDDEPADTTAVGGKTALLGRSTFGVFNLALDAAQEGASLCFVGGHDRILGWFQAAFTLAQAGRSTHPAFSSFRSFNDLRIFSTFAAGAQYAPSVRAVTTYKDDLPYFIDTIRSRLVPEKNADTFASTIHQFKGREAESVFLAGDVGRVAEIDSIDSKLFARFVPEEANIAYVGLTRPLRYLDYRRADANLRSSILAMNEIRAVAQRLFPERLTQTIFDAARLLDGVPIPKDLLADVRATNYRKGLQACV